MRGTVLRAFISALLVLVLGFGAMNLWWLITPRGTPSTQLPGLYDFYSASWGDGLLLPVAIAALVVIVSNLRVEHEPVPRAITLSLAGAGVLAGAVVQVVWLADPAPRLNWTLPAPHHFTAAGWYHGAFFAGACGAFLALLGVLFVRLYRRRKSGAPAAGMVHEAAFTVVVLAMAGFVALVVRDGLGGAFTVAQIATWSAVAVAVLGIFAAIVVLAGGPGLLVLRRVPAVLVWMTAIVAATDLRGHHRVVVIALVALGICVALVLGREARRLTWTTGIQVMSAAFVCAIWTSWVVQQWPENLPVAVLTPVAAMVVCLLFMLSAFDFLASWVDALFVGVHLLVVANVGLYLTGVGLATDPFIFTTVLALASFLQVTVTRQLTEARFQRLIDAEKAEEAGGPPTAGKVAVEVWTWSIGTYFATVVAVLTLTIGAVVTKGFQPGGTSERLSLLALAAGGAVVCVAAASTAMLARRASTGKKRQFLIFLPVMLGIVGWLVLIMSAQSFPYRFYYAPWAFVAGIVMGVVTWESVLSNVSRLNREPLTPLVHVTAFGLGLLSAVNSYWLLGAVASGAGTAESLPRALVAVFLVVMVQMTILVCVGSAAQAGLARLRTRYATWFNLFQDGILFLGLVVVFGFVPLFVFRHLEPLNLRRTWETAFALGPGLTFVGGLLVMTLRNNRDHLARKTKAALASPDLGMPIRFLRSHITFQNRMAVVLAATTLVGLASAIQDVKELRRIVFLDVDSPEP